METVSLKALARKVLRGNQQRNKLETKTQIDGNFLETIKGTKETYVSYMFTKDLMFTEYKKFILQATGDHTVEYLEIMEPARFQIIQDTMQQLDHYFNKRDYQNFMKTINDSLDNLRRIP